MKRNNDKHTIIQDIIISRSRLIELLVVVLILAFGVDLLASRASAAFSTLASSLLGAFFCLGSIIYLIIRAVREKKNTTTDNRSISHI